MLKRITAMLLAAVFCFGCTACGKTEDNMDTNQDKSQTSVTESSSGQQSNIILSKDEMFSDRDFALDYTNNTTIILQDHASKAAGNGVTIADNIVTITKEGSYLLTGTLSEGQIVIDVKDTEKVQLVLDNVSVSNSSTAAILVKQADKVFLTTTKNSQNTVSATGDFSKTEDSKIDGAIYAKSDLTCNGRGTLAVTCAAAHGIVSKDDLKLTGGTYTITAAKQGLSGKDSVRIADGDITIESNTDGIHAENTENTENGYIYICGGTIHITSSMDGMDASNYIAILDGNIDITAGGGSANAEKVQSGDFNGQGFGHGDTQGMMRKNQDSMQPHTDGEQGTMPQQENPMPHQPKDRSTAPDDNDMPSDQPEMPPENPPTEPEASDTSDSNAETKTAAATASDSYKGLKADNAILISGGSITMDTADDAIHSNGTAEISGGDVTLTSGDDGIHADGILEISNGTIEIKQSYEGIEANQINISGGKIKVTASDDGFNAAGGKDGSSIDGRWGENEFDAASDAGLTISGGMISVLADGDGLDSNGSLLISGGTVYISAPKTGGNGSLDYTSSGTIHGGIVIAAGSSGMEQSFDAQSEQGSIHYDLDTTVSAGTEIILKDSNGTIIAQYTPELDYNCILVSVPEITADGKYTLTVGNQSAEIQMNGLMYGQTNGMFEGRGMQKANRTMKPSGGQNT